MRVQVCLGVIAFFALSSVNVETATAEPVGHRQTVWTSKSFSKHRRLAMAFGDAYRTFIDKHRTEREVVSAALAMAKKKGFRDLLSGTSNSDKQRKKLRPGNKVFAVAHGKIAAFVVVGTEPLHKGVHIVASHVDAVRIDLKQNPLYADGNMAMLETHYYGGIKAYQWLSMPLELRGVVITKSGKTVKVAIGTKPNDPVLVIPDIAVHMSRRVDSTEGEDLPSEQLDPILTTTPAAKGATGQDVFVQEAARLLKKHYGVAVSDLASAELELVPATRPRDVGIDRALVGGYGQDDRACTYAALRALLEVSKPRHTAIVVLADKEEIGSTGNTGARSNFIRRVVAELLEATGQPSTELAMNRIMVASLVFSADVTGAVNPQYAELYEVKNAAFLGSGVVWDQTAVHAEVMAYVRGLLEKEGVAHQPANWAKSRGSKNEGGTILPYFTKHGMNGLNVSIPLLSMHSPFELVSKADLYEGFRAYRAFLRD